MRRGHPGAGGGWRDGPRHFRGRGGPAMHYRGSRGFGSPNLPRYSQPGPRFPGPSYGGHPGPVPLFPDNPSPGRGRYGNRSIFTHVQRLRQPQKPEHVSTLPESQFYNDKVVDDPYEHMPSATYARPSPWADPQMFYENQTAPYDEEPKGEPRRKPAGYAGHRPPASDHYGSNPAASNDNSNTFSRSVDDTVDIVRRRLISRGDPQNASDNTSNTMHGKESKTKQDKSKYESPARQGTTARKKQKPRNDQANCDQIKNKIVHQLFKMDKDRIHKLMDNPNSSSKFEYAISNLITESQKSYNHHLRSTAEKSLCGSSTDFINNDNNTIYEDTFMKQMQCILDPQDTVLLEDLKPLVLAELSKVLQLSDLEQGQWLEDQAAYPAREQTYYENELPIPETFGNEYPHNAFKPANDQSYLQQGPYQSFENYGNKDVEEKPPYQSFENYGDKAVEEKNPYQSFENYGNKDVEEKPPYQSFENYANKDVDEKPLFQRRPARASTEASRKNDTRPKIDNPPKIQTSDKSFQQDNHLKNETSDKRSQKNNQTSNVPSSDLGSSREEPVWGRRLSTREEPVWGSKISKPEDRIQGNKSPIPEERSVDSKATVTDIKQIGNKTPIPEDKCTVSKTLVPEEKSMGSNSPLPENIFMGCKSPISDRFENTSPVLQVFETNVAELSDEDEAFAELDRQYHVAVDRNFNANLELNSPPDEFTQNLSKSPTPLVSSPKLKSPEKTPKIIAIKPPAKPTHSIDNDINSQLLDLAKSPLKFVNPIKVKDFEHAPAPETQFKVEVKSPGPFTQSNSSEKSNSRDNIAVKHETPLTQNTTPVTDKPNLLNSRKRSIDQKPSHRKEKRKKIELQPESSNKQILNKNIIINVNDCAGKSSEKCDAPKSIFNLFFAKEKIGKDTVKDVKRNDSSDKGHEKHVKRKDNKDRELSKKSRDKETDDQKKLNSNIFSQSTQSPQASGTNAPTTVKEENKGKLTTIDMFENCKKRPTIIRLSDGQKKTPVTIIDNVKLGIGRKLTKRHVGTQVVRKICSKETQTSASKSCNCKDRKRSTASVQTEPVTFKTASKITDPFERMKEIDIEIQVLLQEKFMLYSSMEAKESCPNTMQSLGMTVLSEDSKTEDVPDLEDAIVDEFANIPVEELEQIALESVSVIPITPVKSRKQRSELKRVKSPTPVKSPVSTRNKKKSTTPNISLIEQIITDDRPLEDIISLDEFEVKPSKKKYSKKTPKKSQTQKPPKQQANKKGSILRRMLDVVEYGIKDCCVVLKREDLTKYMTKEQKEDQKQKTAKKKLAKKSIAGDKSSGKDIEKVVEKPESVEPTEESAVMEETVVNDVQFDMLDVSEDIVIGESCEVKSMEEKVSPSNTICEDIILDNSQSSIEDAVVPNAGPVESECKLFDFSADEALKRDTITVSGNADAVLAIECIGSNFIAACLDGNVYYFSGEGQLLNTLRGSNLAVTCLCIVREKHGITVYTGSLDSRIRYYDLETGLEKGPEGNVLSPIQTMDRAWDTIFVGTRTGFVLQFECKNNMLIPVSTVKFSEQSILALRAMKEGPRKVLLVAARSEAVTIKDAQSGLLLRTLEGPKMTVYTLLFEDGKVYCGTSNHQIHVFDYVSGSHVGVHEGGKGAVCLRAAGGLVFAGCYDGCVYVYREGQPRPLAQLRGPGLMLLSLAVIGTRIIVGYKDRSLYIWKMPDAILDELIL